MQEGQPELDTPGYHQYWNYAKKKGYSGTAIFTKQEPISVSYGLESRSTTRRACEYIEFEDFYFITVYTKLPERLARLDYRMKWRKIFLHT